MFVGRARELGELERALETTRAGSGTTVLIAGEAGIGKTRLASELGEPCRRRGIRRPGRSLDRSRRHGAAVSAARRGPASARGTSAASMPGRRARSCRCSRTRSPCSPSAPRPRRCCSCSRICIGPIPQRWISSCSSPTTSTTGGFCCSPPTAPTNRHRPTACTDSPRASGAQARRSWSNSGHSTLRQWRRCSPPTPTLPCAHALTDAIIARSEGNPFFAEELIAASDDLNGALPTGLRDLLLRRVARLDRSTQSLLRLAAAAGRDVGYPLLRATAQLPEHDVHESLRQAVEHGVLVADQAGGTFRFRHALLAEAIYSTILPGEREELHARLADELARSEAATPAELAPHWAAAGRTTEALVASVEAARQAEGVFGLAEASPISSGRSPCGTPCRTRTSSPGSTTPNSAPGPPSSPAKPGPPRMRWTSPAGDRARRRE